MLLDVCLDRIFVFANLVHALNRGYPISSLYTSPPHRILFSFLSVAFHFSLSFSIPFPFSTSLPSSLSSFPFLSFPHPLTLLFVLISLGSSISKQNFKLFAPLGYLRCCRDSVTALFYPRKRVRLYQLYRSTISRGNTNTTQMLMITCSNANGSLTIRLHTPLRIVRRLIHFTRKCKQLDSTRSRASFKVNRKTLFLAPPCGSLTAIVFLIIHIHIHIYIEGVEE